MKMRMDVPASWIAGAAIVAVPLIAIAAQQHAALRAAIMPPAAVAPASDDSQRRDVHRRLRADASAMAVSLTLANETAPPGLVAVDIRAAGPQPAVIAFAERIETRPPALRFGSWAIVRDAAGVRLTARVIAPADMGR